MNLREDRDERTLESWKEIGAYLQRDARTARNWEKEEGLPIHRHSHNRRSSVYAYPSEIDAWRVSRKVVAAEVPEAAPAKHVWRMPAFAMTALLCLIMVGNGIRPQVASAQQGHSLILRQLPVNNDVDYANLSQDGKWFGGTDWKPGDLVLTRVSNGNIRRLVRAAFDKEPGSWAESPVLSPEQKQVAYLWFDDGDPNANGGQLCVMPNEPGSKSRLLFSKPGEYMNSYPLAWSPDGKRILTSLDKREPAPASVVPHGGRVSFEIAWIAAADGSIQVIKTLEPWQIPSGNVAMARLSPDGRNLVYSAQLRQGAPDTCICVLSADGTTQAELVQSDVNESPVWSPDGAHVLFTSNRSGSFGLWSVAVREGKKAGLPTLVKADTGRIRPIGVTPTGTYYYYYFTNLNQVFVADMDPATGNARGGDPVKESFVGVAPAWSRDGKWLAFTRQHTDGRGYDLIVHSMEKGTDWTFSPNRMGPAQPMWFPDGSVQPMGLNPLRVSVSSGEPKEITASIGLPMGTLSPDGKLVYRLANRDAQNTTSPFEGIEVLDAATGDRKQMLPVPGGVLRMALSPDGKTLSVICGKDAWRLSRMAVDGSNYREIFSRVSDAVAWAPDGRSILFGQKNPNSEVWRIMRIPAEGGQPEFTGVSAQVPQSIEVSLDGSKIVYSGASGHGEMWALDNILTVLK